MNKEIKEILDDLLFTTTLPNASVKLNKEKLNQLKNYITNLQEEIERLNNIISIKTTYIEDLLKAILKSTDIKIQREVYEYGIEYDKKLKGLKEGK